MNKYWLIGILIQLLFAEDLIVDQSSLESYEQDNYIIFDPYGGDKIDFCGNIRPPNGSPENCDKVDFGENGPVLRNNFTIELWVYSDSTSVTHREIIGIGESPSGTFNQRPPTITYNYHRQIRYGFGTNSGSHRFIVDNVRNEKSWNHIAFTFNGQQCKLYVNGEVVHFSNSMSGFIPYGIPITNLGDGFQGKMDELRIWDIARTQLEIQENMDETINGSEVGLIAYYSMDVNENWELIDQSFNQNHAIITDVTIARRYFSNICPSVDGSYDCPYPTIESALNDAKAGNRILIREGRYTEILNKWQLNQSYETESEKIIIEGYSGENVILDGTLAINNNWVSYNHNGHNIYKTTLNMDSLSFILNSPIDTILGVFVNDRYMIPAMQTNFKNPTDPTSGNPLNPEPNTVWSLDLLSPYDYPDSVDYIPGDIAILDTVEEWAFSSDNNTLYLYPSNNYIPNSTNIRLRVSDRFLTFMHSDNIEFKNIHFFAGSVSFYNCSYLKIENCKFSFSSEMGLRGNNVVYGTNTTVRNCIFEFINENSPWHQQRTMFPVMENCLFRYNDWFANSANYPVTGRNYRGSSGNNNLVHGGSTWRYITVENSYTAGIFPGYRSLTEYCRLENLYEGCDCSGIQRNGHNTVGSTTRYCWKLNGARNGFRFNSSCGGNNADIHHVVSLGGKRGFRMKGDYHDAFHLLAYDNRRQDISLPSYKYCGLDMIGDSEIGNLNSNIYNSIAESSLECNSPDCGDSTDTDPFFHLNSSGIWFGRSMVENYPPAAYPHLELQMPWMVNRELSEESLIEIFGSDPFENSIQNYDFRPRRGSAFIDQGVIIPGINNGQDIEFNHPSLYNNQNRSYLGDGPDIGAYEYGDSVYWIPGFRYEYPSVPIPSNGTIEVPIDYDLAFNYPWKTDYNNTLATVVINGPGINRVEVLEYPNNVVHSTFWPGETYNWSVNVNGQSGGNWSFTTSNLEYPLNDRSVNISVIDTILVPYHVDNLFVSKNNVAFLKFNIPSSINSSTIINLKLVPESVEMLNGGIILYKYNNSDWTENVDESNIGLADHSLLSPLDTVFILEVGSPLIFDVSEVVDIHGNYSFAIGVLDTTDVVTFYSREKLINNGVYPNEYGGYAPMKNVWPNLSFQIQNENTPPQAFDLISPDTGAEISISLDNIASELEQEFRWETSYDSDGDGVSYRFIMEYNNYENITILLIDTLILDTVLFLPYGNMIEAMDHYSESIINAQWKILSTDNIDTTVSTNIWDLIIDASNILDINENLIPEKFALHQNYPNPFNPNTIIQYDISKNSKVSISVFDLLGRNIKTLVNKNKIVGYHSVIWDSTNNYGEEVSAGVYLYRIEAGDFRQTKKMVLLK